MRYIKQILEYFFHQTVSDERKKQVYNRMLFPAQDKERDAALKGIWDNIECQKDNKWRNSFEDVMHTINPDKKTSQKLSHKSLCRVAALWLIPFFMMCGSFYMYFKAQQSTTNSDTIASPYLQCYVEHGKCEMVTLPDGSIVWLNSGSVLIYPSSFASTSRDVYLMGEGYFDIAKDSLCHFVVNTSHLKLQVLGTKFNVSAFPGESQITTTLETGSLKVIANDSPNSFHLKPNDQLIYTPSTKSFRSQKVKASDYSDWRQGGIFFDNIPFSEAMQILERTYRVSIHVRTSIFNEQKLYVHYNKNESLENIFHIMKIMIPQLEYKIGDRDVYIE